MGGLRGPASSALATGAQVLAAGAKATALARSREGETEPGRLCAPPRPASSTRSRALVTLPAADRGRRLL